MIVGILVALIFAAVIIYFVVGELRSHALANERILAMVAAWLVIFLIVAFVASRLA